VAAVDGLPAVDVSTGVSAPIGGDVVSAATVGVKAVPADPTVAAGVPLQAMPINPVIASRTTVVIPGQQDFVAVLFLRTWSPRIMGLSRQS